MTTDDHEAAAFVARAASAVHQLAVGPLAIEQALGEIVSVAVQAVAGDVAGVTWRRGPSTWSTVAATDDVAVQIDNAQYAARRGPCLDAVAGARHTRVDDTSVDRTWPEFSDAASRLGVRSSVSSPVIAGRVFGALNVYGRRAAQFDDGTAEVLAAFAAQAAVAGALEDARLHAQQVEAAMDTRSVIEQAKGVIMAARSCDADTAFETLIRQSQHENRKLRDIAAELVDQQQRRGGQPS